MLAWLRTGIAIMAFGFVVARFGLFLRLLAAQNAVREGHRLTPYVGGAFVALGMVSIAGGVIQFQRFCNALPSSDRPPRPAVGFLIALSWTLVAFGLLIGVLLIS